MPKITQEVSNRVRIFLGMRGGQVYLNSARNRKEEDTVVPKYQEALP